MDAIKLFVSPEPYFVSFCLTFPSLRSLQSTFISARQSNLLKIYFHLLLNRSRKVDSEYVERKIYNVNQTTYFKGNPPANTKIENHLKIAEL